MFCKISLTHIYEGILLYSYTRDFKYPLCNNNCPPCLCWCPKIYLFLTTDEIRCQNKSTKSGHKQNSVAFTGAVISIPPNSNYFSTALNLRYDKSCTWWIVLWLPAKYIHCCFFYHNELSWEDCHHLSRAEGRGKEEKKENTKKIYCVRFTALYLNKHHWD